MKIRSIVHLAVHLVEALKTIAEDTVIDDIVAVLLCKLLPKHARAIERFKDQLIHYIPIWLMELKAVENAMISENENERLVNVVKSLNRSESKSDDYGYFATRCLYFLSGGKDQKLSWEDCRELVKEYYVGCVKSEKIT